MKISEKTVPCIIIEDRNHLFQYSGLIMDYTKKVRELEANEHEMKVIEKFNTEFVNEYFRKFIDVELFKFDVVNSFEGYSDLEKNYSTIPHEKCIFLIDYNFSIVNEVTTGIDILKFLKEKHNDGSKFIMLTNHRPDFSFVSKIKNAGFNGIIYKDSTIKSWEIGSLLNRVWSSSYFEFETKAYQEFTKNFKNSNEISDEEIIYINYIALGFDMYQLAEKYFKNDRILQCIDKNGNFHSLKINDVREDNDNDDENIEDQIKKAYNKFKNFRYNIIKEVAAKLNCKRNRCEIIKAGFEYLTDETKKILEKDNYDFDAEC